MLRHDDLIRRVHCTLLDPALLDLHHTVHARHQHHADRRGDGLDHHRSAPALRAIQAHDQELPNRRFERERQYHRDLGEYNREE